MWLYVPGLTGSHSVPGLADLNSESSEPSQTTKQSAMSSEIFMPSASLPRGWKKKPYAKVLSGTILRPLMALDGVASWIASLLASRVSLLASQVSAKDSMIKDGSGRRFPELSEKSNRKSYSLRMSQGSFPWALNPFSRICLRWGSMRTGVVSQRNVLVRPMKERGSSFWPTPTARDWKSRGIAADMKRHSPSLPTILGGNPNPEFYEWLMGFPLGWTALDASETQSSQPKQNLRGES